MPGKAIRSGNFAGSCRFPPVAQADPFTPARLKTSEKLQNYLSQPDVSISIWTKFAAMQAERMAYPPAQYKLIIEVIMAKGTRPQSRPSSGIHVAEDSSPIFNADIAPGRMAQVRIRFPEKSGPMRYAKKPSQTSASGEKTELGLVNPATVLKELFELLEYYAPVWYTEEDHNRALAALAQVIR